MNSTPLLRARIGGQSLRPPPSFIIDFTCQKQVLKVANGNLMAVGKMQQPELQGPVSITLSALEIGIVAEQVVT